MQETVTALRRDLRKVFAAERSESVITLRRHLPALYPPADDLPADMRRLIEQIGGLAKDPSPRSG